MDARVECKDRIIAFSVKTQQSGDTGEGHFGRVEVINQDLDAIQDSHLLIREGDLDKAVGPRICVFSRPNVIGQVGSLVWNLRCPCALDRACLRDLVSCSRVRGCKFGQYANCFSRVRLGCV